MATLVARGAPSAEVFAAVAEEAGRVVQADRTFLARYNPDHTVTRVAAWSATGETGWSAYHGPLPEGGPAALAWATGRPARIDDFPAGSPIASVVRELGVRSAVAVPISVDGRLWGFMVVGSATRQPAPPGTEGRQADFTELAAAAIANADARQELGRVADEQAALRRVATLVARGVTPTDVFAAVTAEAGRVVSATFTSLWRYEPDGAVTTVGTWGADRPYPYPVGTWVASGGANVHTRVFQTHRSTRMDTLPEDLGSGLAPSLAAGVRSGVGAPVWVEGRLWGVMLATSTGEPLPADTEARLAGFTELVATAIANAEAQAALRASRARIIAAADATRRQIERELHAGAQQKLVSVALQLRAAKADVPPGGELAAQLDQVADGLTGALDELREFARGIHPAILADGGLGPALRTLARRCPIPVGIDTPARGRLPEPVEVCAYYVVSEALANAAKHSHAAAVTVRVLADGDELTVQVSDDGAGGASVGAGTGLISLKDRVDALGGQFTLHSRLGEGTTVTARLPLTAESPRFPSGGSPARPARLP